MLTILSCACSTARLGPPPVVIIYAPQPAAPPAGATPTSDDGPKRMPAFEFFPNSFGKMPEKCKTVHEGDNGRRVTWCDCAGWVSNVADVCWL